MSFISDMDMAALEFDVKAAQDVLNMFAEAGKTRIRVQDLLQQCMARIENWQVSQRTSFLLSLESRPLVSTHTISKKSSMPSGRKKPKKCL